MLWQSTMLWQSSVPAAAGAEAEAAGCPHAVPSISFPKVAGSQAFRQAGRRRAVGWVGCRQPPLQLLTGSCSSSFCRLYIQGGTVAVWGVTLVFFNTASGSGAPSPV